MLTVRTGIRAEEVRVGGEHVLFVEGSEDGSLDQAVLRAALQNALRIETMGPSFYIRSAAQALARHHPNYYFLIDRDHYDDAFVEKCWRNFPNRDTDNLLVWRRREIENYFLDPSLLQKSKHCSWSAERLEVAMVRFAQQRLFLDAANYVVSSVREEQKTTWIRHFSNPAEFSSPTEAVERLVSAQEFPERQRSVSHMVSEQELRRRFQEALAQMTGGSDRLMHGQGRWVEMVRGKRVLSQLLHAGGFSVRNSSGERVQGSEMTRVIVSELARDPQTQPRDIAALKQLIEDRVSGLPNAAP